MIEPGIEGTAHMRVGTPDTAIAMRSGDVPVLATPRLLALCEEATLAALEGHLDAGMTTVGVAVALDHLAASPIGASVQARAVLTRVEGRRLTFEVEAVETEAVVAKGTIERALVGRDRFLGGPRR